MMSSFINVPTISFYVSILGIIGMISIKKIEVNSGMQSWISRFADNTDHIVHKYYNYFRNFVSKINKKNALMLVQMIAYHILSWVRDIYLWVHKKAHAHPHSKRVIDMVRGRGHIKRNGGVSFYLRRISEKDEGNVLK